MGMYTECCFGVNLKENTPKEVITILNFMVKEEGEEGEIPPPYPTDHPLFKTDRWTWMLRSGGSYYFAAIPFCEFFKDEISSYRLTFWTNIKNYSGEWQAFLDWIAPYVDTHDPDTFTGFLRYEEDEHPTLIHVVEGKLVLIDVTEMLKGEEAHEN